MKNSVKNNFSRKNSRQPKKDSDQNIYLKNNNFSKNNDGFSTNNSKNIATNNSNERDKKKNNFTSLKRRKNTINKIDKKVPNKASNVYQNSINKKISTIGYGVNIQYLRLSLLIELLIEFGVHRKSFLQRNFIFYSRILNQKVSSLKKFLGAGFQLTFGASHQGVALQLASSKTISLSKLIDHSKKNSLNPIILALDGITDPHNVGAIIRSAEAFDCKGIIIPQRRSAGLTGTVAKVAAGALEHIPVTRVVNLNRALEELKKNGFLVIGLSGDGNLSIAKFNEKTPLVVIVGAEDKGISLLTQKKCDFLIKIPLKGKTSSLNASVATAISLFHLTIK